MTEHSPEVKADLEKIALQARAVLNGQDPETRIEMLDDRDMLEQAREYVRNEFYVFAGEDGETKVMDLEGVYIVWFSKTLQNWKALVSTNVMDDMYYEVTHNGNKAETYIDAYHKVRNVKISDNNAEGI